MAKLNLKTIIELTKEGLVRADLTLENHPKETLLLIQQCRLTESYDFTVNLLTEMDDSDFSWMLKTERERIEALKIEGGEILLNELDALEALEEAFEIRKRKTQ